MKNPFKWLADRTIRNYEQQLRDIKLLQLQNRLRFADTPEQRLAILKEINHKPMKNYYIINRGEKKEFSGTYLNLSFKGIKTLSVVSDNLTTLDCSNNSLTSLSLDCPNLTILDCYNNSIASLSLDCPKLTELYCYIPITLNGEDNIMGIDGYISKVISTHTVGDFTVMKVLDKSNNRELFVAQKGEYSAHGETIEQAISDCNFKHLQATLNVDELVAQIKAKGTVCMNDYRLLTGACDVMSRAFCDEHRIGYAQEVPLPLALKLTYGRYNYGEFKKHF